jgi:hypothetical protein
MLVRRGGFRSSRATSICGLSELSCVTLCSRSIAVKVDVREREGLSTDPRRNLSAVILTAKDLAAMPMIWQLLFRALQMAGSTGRPGDVAVYVNGFRGTLAPQKNTIEMIRINSNPFSAEFPSRRPAR